MEKKIPESINTLANFCAKKDLTELTTQELTKQYGITKVDVLVLFGGSVLAGGDVFAKAIKDNIAKKYIIVGGYGHTSDLLFHSAEQIFPGISEQARSEAELFSKYISLKYQLSADLLETESTNCGNNITNLLELLSANEMLFNSILLMQDATMQRRMDAGLRKHVANDTQIINSPTYKINVFEENGSLKYDTNVTGMWEMEQYIRLLMGEIPRLCDNKNGYGPKGRDYIASVPIPAEVDEAFNILQEHYPSFIRKADVRFKTNESTHNNL